MGEDVVDDVDRIILGTRKLTLEKLGSSRALEEIFTHDDWSSENEEDRRHPSSIRTQLKKTFKIAEMKDAYAKCEVACIARETLPNDICRDLRKMTISGSSEPRYTCRTCGHSFKLRKTLNMHLKVCNS